MPSVADVPALSPHLLPPTGNTGRGESLGVPVRTAVLQRDQAKGVQGLRDGHALDAGDPQRGQRERLGDGKGMGEGAHRGKSRGRSRDQRGGGSGRPQAPPVQREAAGHVSQGVDQYLPSRLQTALRQVGSL